MKCKKCKTDNAPLKKTCERCGEILYGPAINNITGKYGIRHKEGSFTPFPKSGQRFMDMDNLAEIFTDKNQKPVGQISREGYAPITEFDDCK